MRRRAHRFRHRILDRRLVDLPDLQHPLGRRRFRFVSGRLSIKTAGLSDPGRVRPHNEDALWVDPELRLLIVADGLGGHASGEKASGLAVATIPPLFKSLTKDDGFVEPLDA